MNMILQKCTSKVVNTIDNKLNLKTRINILDWEFTQVFSSLFNDNIKRHD